MIKKMTMRKKVYSFVIDSSLLRRKVVIASLQKMQRKGNFLLIIRMGDCFCLFVVYFFLVLSIKKGGDYTSFTAYNNYVVTIF